MNLIEKQIKYSTDDIAKAIALAFSNGNKNTIDRHYQNVKKALSRTRLHITNDSIPFNMNIIKEYIKNLIPIAKNLDKKYNTTIEKNIDLMVNKKLKFDSLAKINDLEFHSLFIKFKTLFDNCLVDENQAYQVYKKDKEIFNLMIIELYNLFEELQQIPKIIDKDKAMAQLLDPILSKISHKYKLYTYQDINNFYNELNSLIIDTNLLNEETRKIVNEYKKKALEKKDISHLSTYQISDLIKQIKSLLNNTFIMTHLQNPHINAHCSDAKIPLSLDYLINISNSISLLHNKSNGALTSFYNYFVCCVFKVSITDFPSKVQNDTIIHELIHAYTLTHNTIDKLKIIDQKYHKLDEFLTEYLSREAISYLKSDILNIPKTKQVFSTLGYPEYELIFKALKNTSLINTLIEIKVNNDYQSIETKVEKETLSLLNSYLEDPLNINKFQKLMTKVNVSR